MAQNILGIKLDVILNQVKLYRPDNYIEVGCYRSETLKQVADNNPSVKKLIGLDLFEPAPDNEEPPFDGPPRTLEESKAYVPAATFIKGDTKQTIPKLPKLTGKTLVFIDGGHSVETTLSDIKGIVKKYPKAKILIDDIGMPGVDRAIELSGFDHIDLGNTIWEIKVQ